MAQYRYYYAVFMHLFKPWFIFSSINRGMGYGNREIP